MDKCGLCGSEVKMPKCPRVGGKKICCECVDRIIDYAKKQKTLKRKQD